MKDEQILLRLRRQYSEREAIKLMEQEVADIKKLLSDSEIERGKLISEIEELKKQVAGWSAVAGRYASGQ